MSDRWLVVVFALVACGGKPPPKHTLSNAAPPTPDAAVAGADEDPADPDEQCDEAADHAITIAGTRGTVELVTCMTGETSTSDEAREAGFVEKQKVARVVWRPDGKQAVTTEIGDWTDGWEWGSSVTLAGVLEAPNGDGVVVLIKSSYGVGPGIGAVGASAAAYRFENDDWRLLDHVDAGTIDVSLSSDARVATVSGCELDDTAAPVGCGGYDDGKPIPTAELRYDGTTITVTTRNTP